MFSNIEELKQITDEHINFLELLLLSAGSLTPAKAK